MVTIAAVEAPPTAVESELKISFETHLQEALKPLLQLLSEPLRSQLHATLDKADLHTQNVGGASNDDVVSTPVITHVLLSSISAWSRSPEGLAALRSCKPPLHPSDYSMIALLAGARTAPDRRFPTNFAPLDHDETPLRTEMNDRRAVTALVNALLSIIGSGVATWWAAERLGWQNEWRVLFALLVAFVVAAAEAGLYLIWDYRKSQTRTGPRKRRPTALRLSDSEEPVFPSDSSGLKESSNARVSIQDTVTTASNIQTHQTADGLRARSQRQT